eukprot:3766993-Heterocapsa_arctica.AAC.1
MCCRVPANHLPRCFANRGRPGKSGKRGWQAGDRWEHNQPAPAGKTVFSSGAAFRTCFWGNA